VGPGSLSSVSRYTTHRHAEASLRGISPVSSKDIRTSCGHARHSGATDPADKAKQYLAAAAQAAPDPSDDLFVEWSNHKVSNPPNESMDAALDTLQAELQAAHAERDAMSSLLETEKQQRKVSSPGAAVRGATHVLSSGHGHRGAGHCHGLEHEHLHAPKQVLTVQCPHCFLVFCTTMTLQAPLAFGQHLR
jgi:hypothetical protein